MKKVKFNFTTSIHMIPDDVYQDFKDKMQEMKFKSFKDYQQRLLAGTEFNMLDVQIGDIVEVPEWYYKAHKDDLLSLGISLDTYKNSQGQRMPFIQNGGGRNGAPSPTDAVNHYQLEEGVTMTKKPRFEAFEESALTHKKIHNNRV